MRPPLRLIRGIRPRVIETQHGWQAVSEPGSALAIGVQAESEKAARKRFEDELAAWVALYELDEGYEHEQPDGGVCEHGGVSRRRDTA